MQEKDLYTYSSENCQECLDLEEQSTEAISIIILHFGLDFYNQKQVLCWH